MKRYLSLTSLLVAMLVAAVPAAQGQGINLGIGASAAGDPETSATGNFFIPLSPSDKIVTWDLRTDVADEDFELRDPDTNELIGTIVDLNVMFNVDPVIILNFAVIAGNADTVFQIDSGTLNFPVINTPQASASAGITLTSVPPASMTGQFGANDKVFQATYNGGTVFANLVDSLTLPNPGPITGTTDENAAVTPLGIPVSSMMSSFQFELIAGASGSGTSAFVIVPEPATAGLLAAGGLMMLRRRRRA